MPNDIKSPVKHGGHHASRILLPRCSANFGHCKVRPIIQLLRTAVGRRPGAKGNNPPFAVQWIGITLDEWRRMKDARDQWIENAYPLVDLRLTRQNCVRWFQERYPGRPLAKSSCVGCPYHSNQEWLNIYRNHPEQAQRAIALDERLRDPERTRMEPNSLTRNYLHPGSRPLGETLERLDRLERMQPRLLDDESSPADEPCGGNCRT